MTYPNPFAAATVSQEDYDRLAAELAALKRTTPTQGERELFEAWAANEGMT